jgi:hypothetical protein
MEGSDIKQTGVTVALDKERKLIFDLNSLCSLEEKYGSVDIAMGEMQTGKLSAIRYFLFLALSNEDDSLTEKQTGKLVTILNLSDIMNKLVEAINVSLPEVDPKNA